MAMIQSAMMTMTRLSIEITTTMMMFMIDMKK